MSIAFCASLSEDSNDVIIISSIGTVSQIYDMQGVTVNYLESCPRYFSKYILSNVYVNDVFRVRCLSNTGTLYIPVLVTSNVQRVGKREVVRYVLVTRRFFCNESLETGMYRGGKVPTSNVVQLRWYGILGD